MGEYEVVTEAPFEPHTADAMTLETLCKNAETDFGWNDPMSIDWPKRAVQLLVYRPANLGTDTWPEGKFPVVFHHHGQGQHGDHYDHLAKAVVDDGAIFVSVGGDDLVSPELRAMINICMLRWLFTAPDWDGTEPGTGGADKLDGNVVIMGHSNGGEAAHIVNNWFEEHPWQHDLTAPEHDMRLCGVVGLAPRGAQAGSAPFSTDVGISGAATVPYLTIEGSLDNDVPGGSLWNNSHSGFDELHTPSDAAKISVWVYDAEHDSFGGGGVLTNKNSRGKLSEIVERARGYTIASTWVDAFVRRFVFGQLAAEPLLFGRELPASLDVPEWWDFHPAYDGQPLLFFGSEPHQSLAPSEHGVRVVVDTMCRWSKKSNHCLPTTIPAGLSPTSEGAAFGALNWPPGSLRSDLATKLAAYGGKRGSYHTMVLRADYTAPGASSDPAERRLAWDLTPLDLSDATALSFRAANVDEVDYPGAGKGCFPVDGDAADVVDFDIVFTSDDSTEVTVPASAYARLVAPDVFEVAHTQVGSVCPVSHFLQTVRVPLDEILCDAFSPEQLRAVQFVFNRFDAAPGRAVLLDTLEFHREPSGASVCE